jgi:hypothetical protein
LRERVGPIGMNPRHAVDTRGLLVDALYFMVQEPTGYKPRSMAKFQVERR